MIRQPHPTISTYYLVNRLGVSIHASEVDGCDWNSYIEREVCGGDRWWFVVECSSHKIRVDVFLVSRRLSSVTFHSGMTSCEWMIPQQNY